MIERSTHRTEPASIDHRIAAAFDDLSKRSTRPRKLIAQKLSQLAHDDRSFTAEDLLKAVRREDSRVGRATVFRSIERLAELHVLDRIDYVDGSHRFFVCSGGEHHHHLVCTECHRVVRFDSCLPPGTVAEIARQHDFSIDDHAITLFGRCPACRKERRVRTDDARTATGGRPRESATG